MQRDISKEAKEIIKIKLINNNKAKESKEYKLKINSHKTQQTLFNEKIQKNRGRREWSYLTRFCLI